MIIDPKAGIRAVKVTSVQFSMHNGNFICRVNYGKMQLEEDEFDYYRDCFIDQTLYVTPKDPVEGVVYYKFESLDELECSQRQFHLE